MMADQWIAAYEPDVRGSARRPHRTSASAGLSRFRETTYHLSWLTGVAITQPGYQLRPRLGLIVPVTSPKPIRVPSGPGAVAVMVTVSWSSR